MASWGWRSKTHWGYSSKEKWKWRWIFYSWSERDRNFQTGRWLTPPVCKCVFASAHWREINGNNICFLQGEESVDIITDGNDDGLDVKRHSLPVWIDKTGHTSQILFRKDMQELS